MVSKKKKPARKRKARVVRPIEKIERLRETIVPVKRETKEDLDSHKFATMSGGIFVLFMIMVVGVFTVFIVINQAASMSGLLVSVIELVLSAIVAFSFTAFMFGHGRHYRPSFMLSMIALVFLSIGVYAISLAFFKQIGIPYTEFFAYVLAAIMLVLFAYPVGYKSKLKWP